MTEHTNNQGQRSDPCTNEELFRAALIDTDEDTAWEAISILHLQGGRDAFERAHTLSTSGDAHERRVGADILGQVGVPDDTFCEEAVVALLAMLEHEQEPEVLSSIAVALGHRRDPRAIEPLVRLKNHPDDRVRFGVVLGLTCHEDEQAIQTLIELSADTDTDVRDWATFALGSQIDSDTPAIHAALLARLADEDDTTRGEAMVGLACRDDQRMVEPLLTDLEAGWWGSLLLEAAIAIGDPRLYPTLVRLREEHKGEKDNWPFSMLEEAIEKCRPSLPS
ncbi:MAG: HEAT repeat domain-containing protein [Ktedonobacteraceae bacterium]|nr:HEAT repeat domain-containing protein [Ktedonobacteraceae bacterium]